MPFPIHIAVLATLLACSYALWVRRDTWSSRWDHNPSRILILLGCAGLLMSPLGPALVDPVVHRMFGLWNVAGLLSVLCIFCTVRIMFEHLVTRLTDQDRARAIGRRRIIMPLKLGLPLIIAVFCIADRGQPEHLDTFAPRGPGFGMYWVLIAVLALPLFGFTGRVLLALRSDPRSKASAGHYLLWVVFNAATVLTQATSVLVGSTVTLPTWICAGGSAVAFAYASARSWQTRADWFKPVRPTAP